MENYKLAKIADKKNDEKTVKDERRKNLLCKALEMLIRELGLTDGSLKVYVRSGRPSPRLEIQTDISKDLEA